MIPVTGRIPGGGTDPDEHLKSAEMAWWGIEFV